MWPEKASRQCDQSLNQTSSCDVKTSMSYVPRFETEATRQTYIRPIYIDLANYAERNQKPRPEPLRPLLLPAHKRSPAERI